MALMVPFGAEAQTLRMSTGAPSYAAPAMNLPGPLRIQIVGLYVPNTNSIVCSI